MIDYVKQYEIGSSKNKYEIKGKDRKNENKKVQR